jgi:hypothetical protein
MAQFRAVISGQRGSASRLGSKASGLQVAADGWNGGVHVSVSHYNGKDYFLVIKTDGSNGQGRREVIAEFETKG